MAKFSGKEAKKNAPSMYPKMTAQNSPTLKVMAICRRVMKN
jgi:hypothetical protein